MRLVSFEAHGAYSWGTIASDRVLDLGSALGFPTLRAALQNGALQTEIRQADAPSYELGEIRLLPPVPDAEKILCVGLNYHDHIAEMGRDLPEKPTVFTRFNDSLVGDSTPLIAPRNSTRFDFEGEFVIVIGTTGRHIPAEQAMDHVLGYTIMNDGSLRDYQRHTPQFTPGKNFPRSGSIGPWIVTADEFGQLGPQRITTTVNGVQVQKSSLDQLVFGVADLISYCSEWTTLTPGDIIATGTPGGVGDGQDPPLYLTPGDVVSVAIEGIGTLTNPVAEEL